MKEFWNERYSRKEFAYGENPNQFFAQELDKLIRGKIFLPAEGEGRNAVYAAKNNWEVLACDLSVEGKNKTEQLANKAKVDVAYLVGDFGKLAYEKESFDAIVLIYAHFPVHLKTAYHALVNSAWSEISKIKNHS